MAQTKVKVYPPEENQDQTGTGQVVSKTKQAPTISPIPGPPNTNQLNRAGGAAHDSNVPYISPVPTPTTSDDVSRAGGAGSPGPHWRPLSQIKQLKSHLQLEDIKEILKTLGELFEDNRRWDGKAKLILPLRGYPNSESTQVTTIEPEELKPEDKNDPYKFWPTDLIAIIFQLGGWFRKYHPEETVGLEKFFPSDPDNTKVVLTHLRSLLSAWIEHGLVNELSYFKDSKLPYKVATLYALLNRVYLEIDKKLKQKLLEKAKKELEPTQKETATAKVTTPSGSGGKTTTSSVKSEGGQETTEPVSPQQPTSPEEIKKALRYEYAWLYNRTLHEYLSELGIDPYSNEANEFRNLLSNEVLEFLADQDHIDLALTFANPQKRQELFENFYKTKLTGGKLKLTLTNLYQNQAQKLASDPKKQVEFLKKANLAGVDLEKADLDSVAPPPPSDALSELGQELTQVLGGEVTPQMVEALKNQVDVLLLTYGDNELIQQALKDPKLKPLLGIDIDPKQLEGRIDFFALVDRLTPEELLSLFSLDTGSPQLNQLVAQHLDEIKAVIKKLAKERAIELAALGGVTALLGTAHLDGGVTSTNALDAIKEAQAVRVLVRQFNESGQDGGEATATTLGKNKKEIKSYAEQAREDYLKRLEKIIASLSVEQQKEILKKLGISKADELQTDLDGGYLSYILTQRDLLLALQAQELAAIIAQEQHALALQELAVVQQQMTYLAQVETAQAEMMANLVASGADVDAPAIVAAYGLSQGEAMMTGDQSIQGQGGGRIRNWLRNKIKQRGKQLAKKAGKKLLNEGMKKAAAKLAAGLASGPAGWAVTAGSLLMDKNTRRVILGGLTALGIPLFLSLQTLGGWLGGIAGGTVGFLLGGPAGAAAGFYAGSLAGWQAQQKLFGASKAATTSQVITNTKTTPFSQTAKQPLPTHQAGAPKTFASQVLPQTTNTIPAQAAVVQTAAAPTAVVGAVTGAGAGAAAAISAMGVMAPATAVGLVVFSSFFTIFTIYSSFLAPVPEGNYVDQKDTAAHYLQVTKTASPKKLNNNPQNVQIKYTITLKARAGYTIKLKPQTNDAGESVLLVDKFFPQRYDAKSGGQPTQITPNPPELDLSYLEDEFTRANTQTISYVVTFNDGQDVIVPNEVSLLFDVYKKGELVKADQKLKTTTNVIIGQPKVFCWPTTGVINQLPNGSYSHKKLKEDAFDIGASLGTTIFAPIPGTAERQPYEPNGYGNWVKLHITDGEYKGHVLIFAHMKDSPIPIDQSKQVTYGDVIGHVGGTGHSDGFHLHFELATSAWYKNTESGVVLAEMLNLIPPNEWLNSGKDETTVIGEIKSALSSTGYYVRSCWE